MFVVHVHGAEEDMPVGWFKEIADCHYFVEHWFDFMADNLGITRASLYCMDETGRKSITWIMGR